MERGKLILKMFSMSGTRILCWSGKNESKIPAGINEGEAIRLAGKGHYASKNTQLEI